MFVELRFMGLQNARDPRGGGIRGAVRALPRAPGADEGQVGAIILDEAWFAFLAGSDVSHVLRRA